MDEASAQNVIRTSIRVMALLDQLVRDLEAALPAPDFAEWKRRIGGVMGDATLDLINPAVALFPSLDVDSDAAWARAGQLDAPGWLKGRAGS